MAKYKYGLVVVHPNTTEDDANPFRDKYTRLTIFEDDFTDVVYSVYRLLGSPGAGDVEPGTELEWVIRVTYVEEVMEDA